MIGLNHINIRADNQDAVRDFLIVVLGVEVGFRPPFSFPGYWLYLDDQPIIHMQGRGAASEGAGWVDHLAFGPFDFDAQKARLDAAGLAYTISGIPGTGVRQLFVTGPEGIKIELNCAE